MQSDEIGRGALERVEERGAEVGEVVGRPASELGALVRRRHDADDPHTVPLELVRFVLVAVQYPRHHLDVVVDGERLAQLGQEVRGRLDPRPVVLVEDDDSRAAAGLGHRARLPPGAVVRCVADGGEEVGDARPVAPVARDLTGARAHVTALLGMARELPERSGCGRDVARSHEHAVVAVAEQVVRGADPVGEDQRQPAGGGLVDDHCPGLPLREEREHVGRCVHLHDPLPGPVAGEHETRAELVREGLEASALGPVSRQHQEEPGIVRLLRQR